ncbi:striated muscle preferentially expressed protein kinase-like [Rhinoderma darwinii]|uniref:striated muscle preferentially expressed protein kinase-like n=1 Tax=Rhinoderma darwinii TaxID=43563 RepID=UPI003F674286
MLNEFHTEMLSILTGVSPFVGENDYTTLMNIRGYTVAFEEKMFADLTREARGFLIKVLGNEKLRPNAEESLEHPWFKTLAKGKNISTDHIKLFQSRRKWQRSLISFKSNMVMRSIPELLQDTSNHLSIAVPRHPKESTSLSSSSDSDDLEELPYVPVPLQVQFSGSRMSLNEIPTDEEQNSQNPEDASMLENQEKEEDEVDLKASEPEVQRRETAESMSKRPKGSLTRKKSNDAEAGSSSDDEISEPHKKKDQPRKTLRKGSSLESSDFPDDELVAARRGELRRGSSADSALLLNVSTEDGEERDKLDRGMTKAASMELPSRNRSPMKRRTLGSADEEYAQRLELMRQRLLRGSSSDNKYSGLRGPLMETLSNDKQWAEQLSPRSQRSENMPPSPIPVIKLTRAASSEAAPGRESSEERVLRKTSSFSHGDTEPLVLHRRSGAPLEIPLAQVEAQRLKESTSLSALTDQSRFDSRPQTPREIHPKSLTPDPSQPTTEDVGLETQTGKVDEKDKSQNLKSKSDEDSKEENVEIILPKVTALVEDTIPKKEIPSIHSGRPSTKLPLNDMPEDNRSNGPLQQVSPQPLLVKESTSKPVEDSTRATTKDSVTLDTKLSLPQTTGPTSVVSSIASAQKNETLTTVQSPLPSQSTVRSPLSRSSIVSSHSPSPTVAPSPLPSSGAGKSSTSSLTSAPSSLPRPGSVPSPLSSLGTAPSSSPTKAVDSSTLPRPQGVQTHLSSSGVAQTSSTSPAVSSSTLPRPAGVPSLPTYMKKSASVPSSLYVQRKEPSQMTVKKPDPQLPADGDSFPKPQANALTPKPSPYAEMMHTLQVTTLQEESKVQTTQVKSSHNVSFAQSSQHDKPPEKKSSPSVAAGVDPKVTKDDEAAQPPTFSKVKEPPKTENTENVQYISNIDSEEVFEAKFKRHRGSSLTRGLKMLTRSWSEEKNLEAAHASKEEEMYRPSPVGVPLEFLVPAALGLDDRSRSMQDLPDAERDPSFMRRLSQRFRKTPTTERKQKPSEDVEESSSLGRRLSWSLGRGSSKERKDTESLKSEKGSIETISESVAKEQKSSESPVLAMRKKIGNTMDRLSSKLRSQSEERREPESSERKEDRPERRTPLMSLLRRSNSEGENLRKLEIPQNQLASQSGSSRSKESVNSGLSIKSEMVEKDERRSRWDRWGLSRTKKDKMTSQPSIPASLMGEDGSIVGRQYIRNESDFPPVFHIKLRDIVILEGESVSLSCLPAGSPAPRILWKKDKMVIQSGGQVNIKSNPDGRQVLTITRAGQREAGLYECVAANALGNATSSCSLAVARIPQAPGTPEIPQKYRDTVLVLWKSFEHSCPCTYILECQMNGQGEWKLISSGIKDCYYNVTELTPGSVRFRVACVNKAGQGRCSEISKTVVIDGDDQKPSPALAYPAQKTRPLVPTVSTFGPLSPRVTSAPTVSPPVIATSKLPSSVGSPLAVTSPPTNYPVPPAPTQPVSKGAPPPTPPRRLRGLPTPPTVHRALPQSAAKVEPQSQGIFYNKLESSGLSPSMVVVTSHVSTVTVSATPGQAVSHLRVPPAPPVQQVKPSLEPAAKTVPVKPEVRSPTALQKTPSVTYVTPVKPFPIPQTAKSPVLEEQASSPVSAAPKVPPPVAPRPVATTPSVPIMLHIPPFKSSILPSPVSPTSSFKPSFPSPPTSPVYKPSTPSSPTYMVTSFISMPPSSPTKETPPPQPAAPVAAPVAQTIPTRVLVKSVTPGKDGRYTPGGRATPSGRESTTLRQGVPQKPYTFLDEKARGRFGVIRECKENATGKHFMAKIIPYEHENKQSVLQEYEVLKCLHHQRILSLHEAYITPRYLVLISEQCAGREILYCLVERFRYSEDDVVNYIIQILQGLEYLHEQKILHLDIKPENIMVSYMNTVKIIDYGSAQTFSPLVLRQLGKRVGTLEYMSPEMIKGEPVGPAADVWGLGVLSYIMLSGRSPFFEMDPVETENKILSGRFDIFKLYSNVSQSASLFIRKLLSIYPWSRPSIQECFSNPWLQDAYLMKLRRQTLTFTTNRLKEFLVEQQRRRSDTATKHKVLLRSYHGTQPTASVTQ